MGETAVDIVDGQLGGSLAPSETSGENQRRVAMLKTMLENSSHDPVRRHHNGADWSAAGVTDSQGVRQNGHSENLVRRNPFYSYYLESSSKGHVTEDVGRKSSEAANDYASFFPPPDYKTSPLDLDSESRILENGAKVSEPLSVSRTYKYEDKLLQTNNWGQSTTGDGDFNDITFRSPAQTHSKPWQENGFDSIKEDLFYSTKDEDFHSGRPKEVLMFEKSADSFSDSIKPPSNKENDLFQFQNGASNPGYDAKASETAWFQTSPAKDEELFYTKESRVDTPYTDYDISDKSLKRNTDLFSSSSTNTSDPFPSPLPRNLYETFNLEDPFGPTPSKQQDYLQGVSNGSSDIFTPRFLETKEGQYDFKRTNSRTTISTPSEASLGTPASTSLLQRKPSKLPPAVPPKPSNKPLEILQQTPFSRANGLSASPSLSPTELTPVSNFRRPPKPLPRTRHRKSERAPKPERPPQPEVPLKPERPPQPEVSMNPEAQIEPEPETPKPPPKPVLKLPLKPPKPVLRLKPKTPESKLVNPENYVVFEDILLIGQEQCVEDWPDDSPELNPEFKPSGKFKLRRESMKLNMDSDGGSSEDLDGSGSLRKKNNRKLRVSLLSRRLSKEKVSDEAKDGRSNSLPLLWKSKDASDVNVSGGDDDYDAADIKKKNVNKVSRLFRRSSAASPGVDRKDVNGHLPQESKDGDTKKKHHSKKNSVRRRSAEEPQGAYGYTPRKGSKENSLEDLAAYEKEKVFDEEEEIDLCLQSASKGVFTDNEKHRYSPKLKGEDGDRFQDTKKKTKKQNKKSLSRRGSKEKNLDEEPEEMENYKLAGSAEDKITGKGATCSEEIYDEEDDIYQPKKTLKLKVSKKLKHKKKGDDPRGAAAADHLSEAAQAEWMAAQKDEGLIAGLDDEDDEEEGDTDSLMEWWYTVEQWDELPSDEEDLAIKEDESKSFTILADKVERGLRVFNKVFTEQAEALWESIIMLHALADDISEFHQKAKIAGITGGTTTAVGSVAAITGLVLAPLTFGASLVVTAVGVGVATAGGITTASAAISDNVNNMQDRKKVETLLKEYEGRMLDISKILHFINQGLYKLRGHPFLRSGTQHYSQDWEIRKAVQMISLVDSPVMRAKEITDDAVASLQGLFQGMDKYFVKDTRELKKGCKKEIVGEIRQVAGVLNNCIVELNEIREDLQKATGV